MKKLALILNKKEKIRLSILSIFGFLNSLAESLSIAMIFPILTFIFNKDKFEDDFLFFGFLNTYLNKFENNTLTPLVLLALVYLFKSIFQLIFIWFQNQTSFEIEYNICKRVFKKFLRQDYQDTIKQNSSIIIEILNREVKNLGQCLIQITNLILEITLIFILIIILYLSFGTLVLKIFGLLILILFLIYVSIGKYFKNWGHQRHIFATKSLMNMFHGINSFKEIKLYKKEEFFINKYIDNLKKSLNFVVLMNTFSSIPRIIYEILFIALIFIYIYLQSKIGFNFEEKIPFLAFIAAAMIRILPGLSRISSSISRITSYNVSIEKIHNIISLQDIKNIYSHESQKNSFEYINFKEKVEIKNITFKYAEQKEDIINNLNFIIKRGDHIGLKGHTGSGKTTLVNLICGLINLEKGNVLIDGINISKIKSSWQKLIGYVPQKIFLMDDTIKNNIVFGDEGEQIDEIKLNNAIKLSQCNDFIDKLPRKLDNIVGENGALLSGGQIQRIGIARALYSNPKLLILDEATNALDINTERKLLVNLTKSCSDQGITILTISHKDNTLKYCDKVYELKDKKINIIKI